MIIERYLNDEIDIEEAIYQLNKNNLSNDKKSEGVVYTPKHIADFMVRNLNYIPDKTILEPSVGHGIFVFSLLDYIEEKFNYSNKELQQWFETKLWCIDINKQNIDDLKLLVSAYFKKRNIHNINFHHVFVFDSLFFDYDMNYDFSIGNPPYIRTKNLNVDYLNKLKNKFKSCESGNIDICYAFTELMSEISTRSSFIVPSSFIYNRSAKSLRMLLKEHLHSFIDFKEKHIFENASIYTSIYLIDKKNSNDYVYYKEDIKENFLKITRNNLHNDQWVFSNIENEGKSILDFSDCYTGIATLRDSLYIIDVTEQQDNDFYYKEYNGVVYTIEKNSCLDFYKGTKLNRIFKIIYPYDNNGHILEEEYININFPNLYDYLLAIKDDLNARDKGKVEKYDAWYAYGRKQGLGNKNSNYYLILPIMTTQKYKCKIIVNPNNFLFVSGFVLGFKTLDETLYFQSIFESDVFFNYISSVGKAWSGKTPYYSYNKTQLKNFKIQINKKED